jgi:hypothetical protein
MFVTRRMAALVAIGVLVSACGGTSKVDELHTQMADVFLTELEVELQDIECTDGAPVEPGSKFQCTAAVTEGEGRLRVQVAIDQQNAAHFTQENALVDYANVETDISADLLRGLGAEIQVTCGDGVLIAEVSSSFRCTATAPSGEMKDLDVSVEDLEAITIWRWVQTP